METLHDSITFSHLPKEGVSVGFMYDDVEHKLYYATAIVNTGVTKAGKFRKSRKDQFSRKRARDIIEGRMLKLLSYGGSVFGADVVQLPKGDWDFRKFKTLFKEAFKPDPACQNIHFWPIANSLVPNSMSNSDVCHNAVSVMIKDSLAKM